MDNCVSGITGVGIGIDIGIDIGIGIDIDIGDDIDIDIGDDVVITLDVTDGCSEMSVGTTGNPSNPVFVIISPLRNVSDTLFNI
jgi:hypothetical protein